jgi:AcrR family transcriptional regulator
MISLSNPRQPEQTLSSSGYLTNLNNYPPGKRRIFLAASKLFFEKSYADVGIREIAVEAGVKVPTVYNHYESKEAILEDLFQYYKDRITLSFNSVEHFDFDLEPAECFKKRLFPFKASEMELMRHLMRIVYTEQHRYPQAAKIIFDISLRGGKRLELALLSHLRSKGVIQCEEIDSMAEIISRVAITFAMQYSRDDEIDKRPDYEKIMMDLFKMILHYSPPKEQEVM